PPAGRPGPPRSGRRGSPPRRRARRQRARAARAPRRPRPAWSVRLARRPGGRGDRRGREAAGTAEAASASRCRPWHRRHLRYVSAAVPPPRSAAAPPVRATVPALAAVYLIWGSTYLAMRYALEGFPPLLMAGVRFIAAGGAMLGWAALRGDPLPDRRQWLAALPVGPLLFVVGNGFIAPAEQSVGSGVAAGVVATMPLWVGPLSAAAGERPGRREWLGVGLGFGAVAFLASGDDLRGEPGATLFLLCSPLGWALGSAVARRAPRRPGGLIAVAGVQMLAGGAAAIA